MLFADTPALVMTDIPPHHVPTRDHPIRIRSRPMPAGHGFAGHTHPWAQLAYSNRGWAVPWARTKQCTVRYIKRLSNDIPLLPVVAPNCLGSMQKNPTAFREDKPDGKKAQAGCLGMPPVAGRWRLLQSMLLSARTVGRLRSAAYWPK
ncbi:hypothetical protein B0O95_112103 [Mycetohabitans endofungorum]|uniref:Uncharacterized protein n=1 Tax=Mycetohabitans endofungorum TaxID=417203 RepID=A0A2P5K884_9BURK|nr:hypothetical protein B0O95_112103 [Mycetohabitans endofungorum]